jgi:hypothetical protein
LNAWQIVQWQNPRKIGRPCTLNRALPQEH